MRRACRPSAGAVRCGVSALAAVRGMMKGFNPLSDRPQTMPKFKDPDEGWVPPKRRRATPSSDDFVSATPDAAPEPEEGRRMPPKRRSMADYAAEWQQGNEAENFAQTKPGEAGAGPAGSASEGRTLFTDDPGWGVRGPMYAKYSEVEHEAEAMENYHRKLHSQGDDEITIKTIAERDAAGKSGDIRGGSSQVESYKLPEELENRQPHNYAGPPRSGRAADRVMQPPQAPRGNAASAEQRRKFLERSGANPYDAYHGVEGAAQGRTPERLADMQQQSPQFKGFLSALKLQAGVMGPMAPVIRHTLDPGDNTYAAIRAKNAPGLLRGKDGRPGMIAMALADWDYEDRRESVATACLYHGGATMLSTLTFALFAGLYYYQLENDYWPMYEQYLGLDVRRVDNIAEYMLMLFTAGIVRVLLMHPAAIFTVLSIRLFRMKRGLPLGPP